MRDCLKAYNAEYCDGDQLLNIEHDPFRVRFIKASRFQHRYLDEPDEHISVQEIEVKSKLYPKRLGK